VQGAVAFLDPMAVATDSRYVEICAANLNAEACYDMRHLTNGIAWREIWRMSEGSPLMVVKVPAPDGVTPRDIWDDRILPMIIALIQEVWRSKKIPEMWLKSYLVGIPKAHDTATRGIALTSTCLKVLTGIIRGRGAGTSLLSCQYGFRSHKGTAQATVLLKQLLEQRATAGEDSTVVFLDLKKAFDSIDRGQLNMLMEEYGFGETARTLVTQMYSGDVMYFYLDNENKSDPIQPGSGVKQGCLLSPTIFNLYMDRALRKLALEYGNITGLDPEEGPIVLAYADDIAVVARNDAEAA